MKKRESKYTVNLTITKSISRINPELHTVCNCYKAPFIIYNRLKEISKRMSFFVCASKFNKFDKSNYTNVILMYRYYRKHVKKVGRKEFSKNFWEIWFQFAIRFRIYLHNISIKRNTVINQFIILKNMTRISSLNSI